MGIRSRARAVRGIAVLTTAVLAVTLAGPPAAPAAGTLVHAYHGDGDAKDAVLGADASDGVLMGATTFGTGHLGQAFAFAGSGDYVRIPSNPSFYPSGSFTVDGWLATTAPVPDGGHQQATLAVLYECANFCPSNQANSVWQVLIYDGRAYGYVRDTDASGPADEGSGEVVTAGPLLNDGALHRITMVRDMDAQVLALYADGIEVAERPLNGGADGALTDTRRRERSRHARRDPPRRDEHAGRRGSRRGRRGPLPHRCRLPGHDAAGRSRRSSRAPPATTAG